MKIVFKILLISCIIGCNFKETNKNNKEIAIKTNPALSNKNKEFVQLLASQASTSNLVVNDTIVSNLAANKQDLSLDGNATDIVLSGEVDLSAFSSLRVLSIKNTNINKLSNLPRTLEMLNCSNNQIDSLDISQLKNLDCLNCNNNQIRYLDINLLPKIEIAEYANNPIQNQLDALPGGLRVWNCSKTNLKINDKLAQSLANHKELKTLECDSNQLQNLPTLPMELSKLSCVHNQLTVLNKLPYKLWELDCTDNQITNLDKLPSELRVLHCSYNQIESLPPFPVNLHNFNCNNNRLKALPDINWQIKELYCANNQLTQLPIMHDELLQLNCANNQISDLGTLSKKLFLLNCANNQISDLGTLPKKLSFLDCSYNKLTNLNNLPDSLTRLVCNNNPIKQLPEITELITELEFAHTLVRTLPVLHDKLEKLNCAGTQIRSLPNFLPASLHNLNCSHNQISSLPNYLPKDMAFLDCSYNQISSLPELLPLELYQLKANNNRISRLDYLPCEIEEINLDSNQLTHIGDLPPSVNKLSFKNNPIDNEQKLLALGWTKTVNNQWDKPRTNYDCQLNYLIKNNCAECVKGYQLTAAAQKLDKLDLSLGNAILGNEVEISSFDLSALSNLRVLNACGMQVDIRKLILPKSVRILDISDNSELDTIEGLSENLLYLKTDVQVDWSKVSQLKWLIIAAGRSGEEDTIHTLPKNLKRLEINSGGIYISDTISWPNLLSYAHLDCNFPDNFFQSPPANLKYLYISNFLEEEFPPALSKLKNITHFACDDCNSLTNLNNLPPNLDTLTLSSLLFHAINKITVSKNLKYLSLEHCSFKNLELISGLGLKKLNLSDIGMPKLPNLNTPNLIELDISRGEFGELPTNWPKSVRTLDMSYVTVDGPLYKYDWTNLPCSYWNGLKVVKLHPRDYENLKENLACPRSKGTRFIYWQ